MKILYITNIAPKEGITNFSMAAQIAAQEIGLEFHSVKNYNNTPIEIRRKCEKDYGIFLHHVDLVRNPFNFRNIKALKQLVEIIKTEEIDIIHANTPVGGVLGRIAGKICNTKIVIYQAHGFHFYKRAPIKNWLLYYPVERLFAKWTDALLTINEEDYNNAKKFHLKQAGKLYKTLGVGLDTREYFDLHVNKEIIRKQFSIPENAVVLITVGEIANSKNQKILLDALYLLNDSNIFLIICGEGPLMEKLKKYSKEKNLSNNVLFLGRRNDIPKLCKISDIFCFPSKREGMGIAALEGMAAGLPLVSSNIQGIKDYSKNGITGYCLEYDDLMGFTNAIKTLAYDCELRKKIGESNQIFVKKYDRTECVKVYKEIYLDILKKHNIELPTENREV